MQATTAQLRDQIADFDDFFRPLRSYFYWERHCFDIPVCWALRSVFDATDGFDKLAQNTEALATEMDKARHADTANRGSNTADDRHHNRNS